MADTTQDMEEAARRADERGPAAGGTAAAAEAASPQAEELAVLTREQERSARARGAALTRPDWLLKSLDHRQLNCRSSAHKNHSGEGGSRRLSAHSTTPSKQIVTRSVTTSRSSRGA